MRRFLIFAVVTSVLLVTSLLASTTACPTAELRFGVHPNIMCLELPGTGERADATLALWRAGDGAIVRAAHRDTVADYGFLLFYGVTMALAGWLATKRAVPGAARSPARLIAAPLGAATADAIENLGIFCMLAHTGPTSDFVAAFTTTFAAIKFALLVVWIAAAARLVSDIPTHDRVGHA